MNTLMGTNPLVLGAWLVAVIGAVLVVFGRRGRLVSRAEFCRKCGYETTSAGARCPECGTRLSVASLRLAFEMNHPTIARLFSATRRGRRSRHHHVLAAGYLALLVGLGIGAGVPAMRLAKVDLNYFRSTETLLRLANRRAFDLPEHDRVMGELKKRLTAGRLQHPQAKSYQLVVRDEEQHELDLMVARSIIASQQPIYASAVAVPNWSPKDRPAHSSPTARAPADDPSSVMPREIRPINPRAATTAYQLPPSVFGLRTGEPVVERATRSASQARLDLVVETSRVADASIFDDVRNANSEAFQRGGMRDATHGTFLGAYQPSRSFTSGYAPPPPTRFVSGYAYGSIGVTSGIAPTRAVTGTFMNSPIAPTTYNNAPLGSNRISTALTGR